MAEEGRVKVWAKKADRLRAAAVKELGTSFVRPVDRPVNDNFPRGWDEYEQTWEVCPHDRTTSVETLGSVRFRQCEDCDWQDQAPA